MALRRRRCRPSSMIVYCIFFFFQAEDGIRDKLVTGVQTCALPISRDIAAELQRATPERQVEFAIAAGLKARGDARLLRVALDNLLRNGWKYTARRPGARVEFASVDANGGQAFMVRDNGAGFDMKYADKLFGVFQRLHSAAEFEGTGVGLATVRRIINRHGGRIWAEGAVDQGATFYFTL